MALVPSSRITYPRTQPTATLTEALADFEKVLTTEQREQFTKACTRPDASSVLAFVAQIDSQTDGRARRCFAPRLCSFLEATEQFVGVVDTFVSARPTVGALVWGGVKTAILAASNVASYFEKISGMIMNIGQKCPTLQNFGMLYPNSIGLQAALCEYYSIVVRFCAKFIEVSQRTGMLQSLSAIVQPFEADFKPLRNALDMASTEIEAQITLASNQAAREEANLSEIERKKNAAHRQLVLGFQKKSREEDDLAKEWRMSASRRRISQMRSEILANLTILSHAKPLKRAMRERLPETAEWFQQNPAFLDWREVNGSTTMWCSGNLGTGKTVLAGNVVAHLSATQRPTDIIAYCFCRTDIPESCQARQILGSIAAQMLQSQVKKLDDGGLAKLHSESLNLDFTDLVQFVCSKLLPNFTYYVVLDGLDECENGEIRMIETAINALCAVQDTECKLFCAGRPQIEQLLFHEKSPTHRMSLTRDNVESDIQKYIELSLNECLEKEEMKLADPRLILEIKTALENGANGMILWARLLIQELCSQNSDRKIQEALRNLPKDLSELFDRKLLQVKSRPNAGDAVKILQFCGVAKRPLTTSEAREALTIALGQTSLDAQSLSNNVNQIVADCCGLIDVDEEDQSIHYIHHSVYQHLFQTQRPGSATYFDKVALDKHLGLLCLTYINFTDFERQLTKKNNQMDVRIDPLRIAAAAITDSTVTSNQLAIRILRRSRRSKDDVAASLRTMTNNVISADENARLQSELMSQNFQFLNYVRQYWIWHLTRLSVDDGERLWRVFAKCAEGVISIVDRPWQNLTPRNRDWKGIACNALVWSLANNHTALLHCRLKSFTLSEREECFTRSVKCNYNTVVRTLIDLELVTEQQMTCELISYAKTGSVDQVKMLLDAGAKVNSSVNGETALCIAVQENHVEVVKVLLAAGAEVDERPREPSSDTALQVATREGRVDMMDMLLAANADVNAPPATGYGGLTALQAAVESGHVDVVERLLAANADVNAPLAKEYGLTALQAAAQNGHIDIVDRLLAANADVNAPPAKSFGHTALEAAIDRNHIKVVDRLLAAGADVNAAHIAGYNRTPLQTAIVHKRSDIIKLLKEAGAVR